MATEKDQSTATTPTSKEEGNSSQGTGLIQKSRENGAATQRRPGVFGLPLSPQELLGISPFFLLERLTEDFHRILRPFVSDSEEVNVAWVPRVEVAQHDGSFQILAELPGLSPNEVRVEVDDGAVILQGERQVEREANEGGIRRSERQFGLFYRRIPLPEGADPEHAKARFRDGLLEITVPAPGKQPERRQIQVESDSKPSSDTSQSAA